MSKINYAFWAVVIIFAAVILVSLMMTLKQNDGRLIYALDDAYIHMAIAKNVVEHGVWGVTRYEFASASSSPLWTGLLILGYSLLGVNEYLPLLLNFVVGVIIIYVLFKLVPTFIPKQKHQFILVLTIIFVTPVTALSFSGMEHNLHFLLTLLFLAHGGRYLSSENGRSRARLGLLLTGPFLAVVRYEGIFAILMMSGLLLWKKEFRTALLLLIASAVPISLLGFWSLSQGGYFLPTSVLLKGNAPQFDSLRNILFFPYMALRRLVENAHALIILVGVILTVMVSYKFSDTNAKFRLAVGTIFTGMALLHLMTAGMGWFYRYEAYLVGTGLFIIGISLGRIWPAEYRPDFRLRKTVENILLSLLAVIILGPFILRASQSLIRIQQATRNIYEQQYQMARFFREYYSGQPIAVNDIGVVNFYADVRCLDLWGLASQEVARAQLEGTYDSRVVRELTEKHRIKIAIVYDNWFANVIPEGFSTYWEKCGAWQITDNKVCGSSTVAIYCVDPPERENLLRNLKAFSPSMPSKVRQSGMYSKYL